MRFDCYREFSWKFSWKGVLFLSSVAAASGVQAGPPPLTVGHPLPLFSLPAPSKPLSPSLAPTMAATLSTRAMPQTTARRASARPAFAAASAARTVPAPAPAARRTGLAAPARRAAGTPAPAARAVAAAAGKGLAIDLRGELDGGRGGGVRASERMREGEGAGPQAVPICRRGRGRAGPRSPCLTPAAPA